jgi:hypothetical protein
MKTTGNLITHLIQPIARKFGFVQGRILMDWSKIVGNFDRYSKPQKVEWNSATKKGRLIISLSSGMVTQFHYQKKMILDRLNQYFGYNAIEDIKVIADPRLFIKKEAPIHGMSEPEIPAEGLSQFQHFEGKKLKVALSKLSCHFIETEQTIS